MPAMTEKYLLWRLWFLRGILKLSRTIDSNMKKILFVEDDDNFSDIVMTILRKDGFEVVLAKDGEEGLNLVKTEKPDLVLLDLVMPRMDGFDFLKYLRSMEGIPWIPVIVFTGQADAATFDKATRLGCQGYLVKTEIDKHTLKDKLNEFLPKS